PPARRSASRSNPGITTSVSDPAAAAPLNNEFDMTVDSDDKEREEMTRLTTLFWAAAAYMAAGLASGLYYRELTKGNDFTGFTQTSVMHTHLLTLGMLVFLVMMALEKIFMLSRSRAFTVFFWLYNAGLVVTVAMMGVHGTRTVLGLESGPALAGISGLGH